MKQELNHKKDTNLHNTMKNRSKQQQSKKHKFPWKYWK